MIGICMKYNQKNYGGMIQALALCTELEKRQINYELIRYQKHDSIGTKIRYIPRLFNAVLINDKKQRFFKNIEYRRNQAFKDQDQIRYRAFDEYADEKFTKLSPVFIGYEALCKGAERYQAVVVGSDQLWSPAGLPTNFYNLMFVPEGIRKIAVASSFGVSQIPWYQKSRTAKFLKRIEFLSVRENRASAIIRELTGREALVAVDPVFLLSKEEWEKIIPVSENKYGKYVFAYLLGKNPEHRKAIEAFAKKKGLRIVTFRHVDQYNEFDNDFGDEAPFEVRPDEFLNILRNAEYIFTDSFHGGVFSIIHEKRFVIFDRYSDNSSVSKNSRIDSLCENLGIQDCRYRGDLELCADREIDYPAIERKVNAMTEETRKYLDRAFSGVE